MFQFRALSDQLYKTSDFHKRVRQEIVQQLKSRPKSYKGFVDKMEFSQYVKKMSSDSVWGDEVTLKAAADLYGVKIVLITSIKDNPSIVILPKSEKEPGRVIHLSYLAGIHYNSIHLNEGLLSLLLLQSKYCIILSLGLGLVGRFRFRFRFRYCLDGATEEEEE